MSTYQFFYNDVVHSITDVDIKKFELEIEDRLVFKLFLRYMDVPFNQKMHELVKDYFNEKDYTKIQKYFVVDIVSRKKNRWKSIALRDLKQKKVKKPKELYGLYVAYEKEMPELAEVKIEPHISAIEEWAKDTESFLYEYPFFEDKTKATISKAISDDITIMFLNFLEKEIENSSLSNIENSEDKFREYPESPMVYDTKFHRKPLDFDGLATDEATKETVPYKEIKQDDLGLQLYMHQSESAAMLAKEFGIDPNPYDLDPLDEDVLAATLSFKDESFSMDNLWISTTLEDLIGNLFPDKSPNRRDAVLSRIYKLLILKYAFIKYDDDEIITSSSIPSEGKVFGFFDNFEFRTDASGSMFIRIKVNEVLYTSMINSQTLKIYKEQIDILEPKYKSLLLYLQKERINAHRHAQMSNSQDMNVHLTLRDFAYHIRLQSRTKKTRMKEISEGLDRLKELNIIVEHYFHGNELFVIDFQPMTEEEVVNIISDSATTLVSDLPLTDISHTKTGKNLID